ncbi:MAG TPA: response regulator [Rhizomicrobium sp.]|nr:response regulator [Rhizomicrobium sp.]
MSEQERSTIFVVDDDRSILRAFSRLLGSAGYDVRTYDTPADFLSKHDASLPGCALLDVRMEEIDGLGIQDRLREQGSTRPVIFVTSCDDVKTSVHAMKAGALDFLSKPVHEPILLAAVKSAVEKDRQARQKQREVDELGRRFEQLTTREREVMDQVVKGRLNKQIASELAIVEKTVKVHRARVMEKMGVRSLAALVHVANRLGLGIADFPPKEIAEKTATMAPKANVAFQR